MPNSVAAAPIPGLSRNLCLAICGASLWRESRSVRQRTIPVSVARSQVTAIGVRGPATLLA